MVCLLRHVSSICLVAVHYLLQYPDVLTFSGIDNFMRLFLNSISFLWNVWESGNGQCAWSWRRRHELRRKRYNALSGFWLNTLYISKRWSHCIIYKKIAAVAKLYYNTKIQEFSLLSLSQIMHSRKKLTKKKALGWTL